jgi:hypothetical protein
MDETHRPNCMSQQRIMNLLPAAALAPWLFCPPLMAQQTYKKPIELDFAVGIKTTHQMDWYVLDDMKRSNMSRGAFAEGRWGIGQQNGFDFFVRLRAALDDWKRDTYSDYPQFSTAVRRVRGTIGGMMVNMRKAGPIYAYGGVELGVSHWGIDSTHPLFGNQIYSTFTSGPFVGFQTEHIFLELASESHSKSPRDSPVGGYIKEKPVVTTLDSSVGLSLMAGWRF